MYNTTEVYNHIPIRIHLTLVDVHSYVCVCAPPKGCGDYALDPDWTLAAESRPLEPPEVAYDAFMTSEQNMSDRIVLPCGLGKWNECEGCYCGSFVNN